VYGNREATLIAENIPDLLMEILDEGVSYTKEGLIRLDWRFFR